ncbi:hypothetical protein EDB92DRAFT_1955371 [Lactarius akahatsu]|uniref:Uncharacterized protein n=1 Tax=Lactarius akahatsu TaxID=416441 RepID=A0AAD4L3X2_9AGAM|nr:hypothetical protein EDB92DRAFT_1955371 [Lactarius akahatsu]
MFSRKANEARKEADMAEDRSFRPTKANSRRRKTSFYKVLQGMPIARLILNLENVVKLAPIRTNELVVTCAPLVVDFDEIIKA